MKESTKALMRLYLAAGIIGAFIYGAYSWEMRNTKKEIENSPRCVIQIPEKPELSLRSYIQHEGQGRNPQILEKVICQEIKGNSLCNKTDFFTPGSQQELYDLDKDGYINFGNYVAECPR